MQNNANVTKLVITAPLPVKYLAIERGSTGHRQKIGTFMCVCFEKKGFFAWFIKALNLTESLARPVDS